MRRKGTRDDGTATVEFVVLAVVLLVPFVYAVLCVFEVQRAAYALSAASREAGRAFVTAPSGASAQARGRTAAELTLEDHGITRIDQLRFACSTDPCLTPDATVRADLTTVVALPLVPHWGGRSPTAVRLHAEHVEVVDTYRPARP